MNSYKDLLITINNNIAECVNNFNRNNLYIPIKYCLDNGGKRIRPILCLLANEIFGGNSSEIIDVAVGIEIFHNFTLLHDDIMDNSDMRRGKEAVHKKWNNNVAILSGDAMSILAYEKILATQKTDTEIIRIFSEAAMQVCEGQQMDMDFENTIEVSVADYLEMIKLKTAVLLAASLKIGAYYANADKNDIENIYNLGINLGIAFQLQDDLLDSFGNDSKFKKILGGDIVENKKTFLLIKALELSDVETKNELISWLNVKNFDKEEKINAVKNIYKKLKIDEISNKIIDFYFKEAEKNFNNINIASDRKKMLADFIAFLSKRDY